MTTNTATTSRQVTAILDEASAISAKFKANGRTVPKDPNALARAVTLMEESGLAVFEFCRRSGFNASSMYYWKEGKTTAGKPWPALAAALAKRQGANLAAFLNAGLSAGPTDMGIGRLMNQPPNVVPLHPEETPRRYATPVTLWRAEDGSLHDTPDAERVSLQALAVSAASGLWLELGDQPTVETLVGPAAPAIIRLADALRARDALGPVTVRQSQPAG